MRLARRCTGFTRRGRRGASINGAIKFHVNFIGAASCNPAIGGLAKGRLVKEIDAPGRQTKLALDAPFG
nr:FAD-dependent oxidoreductase [Campylobacter rectus]